MTDAPPEKPMPLALALLPLLLLIGLLSLSVHFFGDDATAGPNQIALLLAGSVAAAIGMARGLGWKAIEEAIIQGIANAMIAILILLVVGSVIGSWMLSGTVQTLIWYGLLLLSPDWFYAAACLVCAIAATSIGSSWTVAGTLGVAFMGMATALQLNPAITAGAIISGAYFGDKLSPLSDTTNLAAAVTGTPLFVHIRNMLWTTLPGFAIAMVLYLLLGGRDTGEPSAAVAETMALMSAHYHISLWLLVPVVLVFVLAWRRVPPLIALFIGALVGGAMALVFQPASVGRFLGLGDGASPLEGLQAVWLALATGYHSETGDAALDQLLSRGGMASMLETVWLILCAVSFGAVMERAGILQRVLAAILAPVRGVTGLIVTTVFACIGTNVMTAEQYISIILPGRLFRLEYARYGLARQNLSRTLEDSGTLTSALIPWSTCGAYMAGALGVATLSYLPWTFFNLLGPVLCIAYAATHFRLVPLDRE